MTFSAIPEQVFASDPDGCRVFLLPSGAESWAGWDLEVLDSGRSVKLELERVTAYGEGTSLNLTGYGTPREVWGS